jgi:hypothetical protein
MKPIVFSVFISRPSRLELRARFGKPWPMSKEGLPLQDQIRVLSASIDSLNAQVLQMVAMCEILKLEVVRRRSAESGEPVEKESARLKREVDDLHQLLLEHLEDHDPQLAAILDRRPPYRPPSDQ